MVMIKKEERLPLIHPGEILKEEFLDPMGISQYKLANDIGVPQTQISQIVHGKRSITPITAVRFGLYFGNTAEFWMNLQRDYDLEVMEDDGPDIKVVRPDGTEAIFSGRELLASSI